ncbi:MAG TPA: HAMP domain-containing histidine kinase [Spirochaetia bacterium]|nr:HAMP domain-containing histidine kinase [Spirochaetia bacterium]
MSETALIVRISTAALFLFEILITLFRLASIHRKREALIFLGLLGVLFLKNIINGPAALDILTTLAVLFLIFQLVSPSIRVDRKRIYDIAGGGALLISGVVLCIGDPGTLSAKLFFSFFGLLLGVPPLIGLWRFTRQLQKPLMAFLPVVLLAGLGAGGAELFLAIPRPAAIVCGGVILLAAAVAIGVFLCQENYLLAASFHGLSERLFTEEQKSREAFTRLLSTEDSLLEQDRLISIGILAGGLAHEFKNILSLISSCAQFGLDTASPEKKNRSFAMIEDHIDHSMGTVIGVLDQIRSRKRIDPEEIDLNAFLTRAVKIYKSNYRGLGIDITFAPGTVSRVTVRKNDLEQILLNLIRNAAAALLSLPDLSEKRITLFSRTHNGGAVIEVRDNAGGVEEEAALTLFERRERGTTEGGLGLYLLKLLADKNDLVIRYTCLEGESRFSVFFP